MGDDYSENVLMSSVTMMEESLQGDVDHRPVCVGEKGQHLAHETNCSEFNAAAEEFHPNERIIHDSVQDVRVDVRGVEKGDQGIRIRGILGSFNV